MGYNYITIYFQNILPTHRQILEEVEHITGLTIKHTCIDFYGSIDAESNNKKFTDIEYEILLNENKIQLGSTVLKPHYLRMAFISAMYNLGAERDYELPKWTSRKWKDKKWWQYIPR